VTYVQPTVALVFDNSLTGYVSPLLRPSLPDRGRPSIGSWMFTQLNVRTIRRYDGLPGRSCSPAGSSTSAGWAGRARVPHLRRNHRPDPGQHSGSYRRNECLNAPGQYQTGCGSSIGSVGTQLGVASFELRMPLSTRPATVRCSCPRWSSPCSYDMGLIWDDRSTIAWNRERTTTGPPCGPRSRPSAPRCAPTCSGSPSAGLDYAIPLDRPAVTGLWTFSLGTAY
jgi:hypothetical protein